MTSGRGKVIAALQAKRERLARALEHRRDLGDLEREVLALQIHEIDDKLQAINPAPVKKRGLFAWLRGGRRRA